MRLLLCNHDAGEDTLPGGDGDVHDDDDGVHDASGDDVHDDDGPCGVFRGVLSS